MHRLVVSLSSAALMAAGMVFGAAAPAAATEDQTSSQVCVYVLVQGEDLEEFRPVNPCVPVQATDCYGTTLAYGRTLIVFFDVCVPSV